MSLKLYNSLSRKKEEFVPLDPNHVRMYACGPTVYNYAHIGNARMAVVFDLWARVLKHLYPKVTYASNITDVEDKIIVAADEAGVPIAEITEKYTKIYNDDMATLGVALPDVQPKATEHIQEMIDQIEALIERGHAYEAEGHVLFHVPSDPSYGALSGRSRDEQVAGARVEVAPYKKDPADFVLWKPSNDDQPGWDSPWGNGRPGWHIECSAMAEKHLGLPFDIHGGGADLKFPHHENEIAQSCCANDKANDPESFSKYWVHNGFVTVEGEKMSKSLGNFLLVHDLIEQYPGEVLRLTLLSAHYRQPLDWSEQVLHQNQKLLDRLYRKLENLKDVEVEAGDIPESILDALKDDLNTPQVLAEINKLLKEKEGAELKASLLAVGKIVGILQQDPSDWFAKKAVNLSEEEIQKIEALIEERAKAKSEKDFIRADQIRDELLAMNIEIKDARYGVSWQKIS
ncbi:MAG: cysteine--tRNA ligase [Pseudomonadota bacterium]